MLQTKMTAVLGLALVTGLSAFAADVISPEKAATKKPGETICVEMKVVSAVSYPADSSSNAGYVRLFSTRRFDDASNFIVVLTPKAIVGLKRLGVKDMEKHFEDKIIRATGRVGSVVMSSQPITRPGITVDAAENIQIVEELTVRSAIHNPDLAAELTKLQEQRVATLKKLLELSSAGYRNGEFALDQVLEAQHELTEAELEMVETPDQRIALLETQLKIAKQTLEAAEQLHRAAVVSQCDTLRARAAMLGVEIKLLQERPRTEPTPR
jgi:hypothetical protein